MTPLPPALRNPLLWDKILTGGLLLYSLCIFLPGVTALERLGLVTALLISCTGGRWKACLAHLRHPAMLLTITLLGWFTLSATWSVAPDITLTSVQGVFKDYLLILPPLFFMLADPDRRRWFARGLALAGLVIVLVNSAQYVREWLQDPALLNNIKLHRGWGHPLVLFFPFALLQGRLARGKPMYLWYGLAVIEAMMIMATGARGAWLALAMVLVVWLGHDFDRRRLLALSGAGLALVVLAYFMLPAPLFKDRFADGLSTSLRTSGTWGPALQMLDERPVLGFGFGKPIFDQEFNRRAPTEAGWSIKKSKGPHSIYLEAGFSGGYPALGLITALFLVIFVAGIRAAARGRQPEPERLLALACLAAFAGFYITRGSVESVQWSALPLLLAPLVFLSPPRQEHP